MPDEIERKFLLMEDGSYFTTSGFHRLYDSINSLMVDASENGIPIKQGYLEVATGVAVAGEIGLPVDFQPNEARLREKGGLYFLTLKGKGSLSRSEKEVEINQRLFREFWGLTFGKRVEKVRLKKPFNGNTVEADVYTDRRLVIAEVEFPTIESAQLFIPLGRDVTGDEKYKNRNLAR